MKRIILKLFVATFPLFFIFFLYVYYDPFMVVHHYDHYYKKDSISNITLNTDYIATETFLNNEPKYNYDSYIFGNSRARYYPVSEWEKFIPSAACYHFDAYGESLFGVERKIAFLAKKHIKIKNALVVIDGELIFQTWNGKGHVYLKHPSISGQTYINFQMSVFKDFLDIDFIMAYMKFLKTHKVPEESVERQLFESNVYHYEEAANEMTYPVLEQKINTNRDSFYKARAAIFYKRDTVQKWSNVMILDQQKKLFYSIKKVFDEDGTDCRIIISPMYDQKKMNPVDLQFLKSLFGDQHVFDFSGINEFTASKYNYYEDMHYRPFIASRIIDSVYSTKR